MINKVTVINHLGESLELELRFPEKSGFLVQRIDGLGPSKASVSMTEMSTTDGALYNSARMASRNIVFYLLFLSDTSSIEDVRQKSYRYFPTKKQVTVKVETDTRTCVTTGYVESNEVDIFSGKQSTSVSILCPSSYLYSLEKVVTLLSGVLPLFKFPFSNESLASPLIELGSIQVLNQQTIVYEGDADVGVVVYINVNGPATNITIHNTGTLETMLLDTDKFEVLTGTSLTVGDEIIISTVPGSKSVTLLRDGEYYNILGCIDKYSDWFQLTKGDNIFAYTADTGAINLQLRIENQIVYEGV